jgi:hypothetical protein
MDKQKINYSERYKEYKTNYMKIKYQERREEFLQKNKEYREKNIDYINEKIKCSCGYFISRKGRSQHEGTKKHLEIVNENNLKQHAN